MLKISPGQALLILIDKYRDDVAADELKKLYLSGAKSTSDRARMDNWFKDPALKNYSISFNHKTIDEDPSRRYFETHLAYETLKYNLKDLDSDKLKAHYQELYRLVPLFKRTDADEVLNGIINNNDSLFIKEYSDAINKIESDQLYKEFSKEDKEKLILLMKNAFLGIIAAMHNPLPINIYGEGIFSDESKGKLPKGTQQFSVRSKNTGLLKSYMPAPQNDAASIEIGFSYMRPADQARYNNDSEWAKLNFRDAVHPFSNSISGTMLCQIRVACYLLELDQLEFDSKETFYNYIKCFTSALLYNSGGHTLHEFIAPLMLSEVQPYFKSLNEFNSINEENLFFVDNQRGFNQATDNAIFYNKVLLNKRSVHSLIREDVKIVQSTLKDLLDKCNGHVYPVLSKFITEKMAEINLLSQKYDLTESEQKQVELSLLNQLNSFNFNHAYLKKEYEFEGIADAEINYPSFVQYIDRQSPNLINMDKFIKNEFSIDESKKDILDKLEKIRSVIKSYQNSNKYLLIYDFNEEINRIKLKITRSLKLDIHNIKMEIDDALKALQSNENKYYHHLFFSSFRQSHSSLQSKINEAVKIAEQIGQIQTEPSKKIKR